MAAFVATYLMAAPVYAVGPTEQIKASTQLLPPRSSALCFSCSLWAEPCGVQAADVVVVLVSGHEKSIKTQGTQNARAFRIGMHIQQQSLQLDELAIRQVAPYH